MKTAGIDIGGTQLRVGIFDEEHRMVDSLRALNNRSLGAAENMAALMGFLRKYRSELRGVGIGTPGPIDRRRGRMLNPPNLVGWDNFEIVRFVQEETGLKAVLNNDGNVAGLAEAVLGAGKGCESAAFMGISTGVGGAFISGGRIINGAHDNCAEIWNMIVNEDGHCHKNANPGCLNEQVSGSGLARIATERYGRGMSARELFELHAAGDPVAEAILARQADTLARGIANISCTLDPECIIIGGSVAIHNWSFILRAAKLAEKYINYPGGADVRPAVFGDDAGIIGASLLV